jgi:hypothetical protein
MKTCSKCGQVLDENCFWKNKKTKDGLRNQCKNCQKEENKQYYNDNKKIILEKQKEYYKEYSQRPEVKEHRKKYWNEYYQKNSSTLKEHKKEYYSTNPELQIRVRLNNKVRKKSRQLAFRALGYNFKEVLDILLQKAGLTELTKDWHIDHILPFSMFDHNSEIGRNCCWCLDNLRIIQPKRTYKSQIPFQRTGQFFSMNLLKKYYSTK